MADSVIKQSDLSDLIRKEVSDQFIFDDVQSYSVIQSYGQHQILPDTGVAIPVFTGDPEPAWQNEGEKKVVKKVGADTIDMIPKTLAIIFPMSSKVMKSAPEVWKNELRLKAAKAFAKKFDKTCLHDSIFGAANFLDASEKNVILGSGGSLWNDLIESEGLVSGALGNSTGYLPSGFIFDNTYLPQLKMASAGDGTSLFYSNDRIRQGALGNPISESTMYTIDGLPAVFPTQIAKAEEDIMTVGYVGDFTKCAWGQVGDIRWEFSDTASATIGTDLVSAFENNLTFVRAETDFGFVVKDKDAFVKLAVDTSN